jgi:hypothetical protein
MTGKAREVLRSTPTIVVLVWIIIYQQIENYLLATTRGTSSRR